jgi:hypothetical protein
VKFPGPTRRSAGDRRPYADLTGKPEVMPRNKLSTTRARSLSAVSEAPTREDLPFRCAVYGRFRYSDLKEAAPRTMGFVCG